MKCADHDPLHPLDPKLPAARAAELARFNEDYDGLIYEAHSTDSQLAKALWQLVENHFAILKVGPALTFALREGIYALTAIEEALIVGQQTVALSQVREVLEAMLANPKYWQKFYQGGSRA
jgi:D-tagatose-1,6-bisphosphate aldolase subunit GatZ/KbaZ